MHYMLYGQKARRYFPSQIRELNGQDMLLAVQRQPLYSTWSQISVSAISLSSFIFLAPFKPTTS